MKRALLKEDEVKKRFEGKTIARIDGHAVNVVTFHFTDGTSVCVETEYMGHGLYGLVACDPEQEGI